MLTGMDLGKLNQRTICKAALIAFSLLSISGISERPVYSEPGRDQFVRLQTTKGPIVIRVFYSIVPYTAGNFLDLVDSGFYNGLSFHRVENWVVQGGDPNGNGSGHFMDPNTGQPKFLRLEIHPQLNHNQAGAVAMARSQDRNSASCQFYILKSPMPQLNGQYAVFGRVVDGMNSVYAMGRGDRIISASILQQNNTAQSGGGQSSVPVTESSEPAPTRSGKPAESGF